MSACHRPQLFSSVLLSLPGQQRSNFLSVVFDFLKILPIEEGCKALPTASTVALGKGRILRNIVVLIQDYGSTQPIKLLDSPVAEERLF